MPDEVDEMFPPVEQPEYEEPQVAPLPEAGGIAFMTLYTPHGAPINLTARSHTCQGALQELLNTVKWAMDEYKMTTTRSETLPSAQSPAIPADQKIALEEGNKALAQELHQAASDVPAAPAGKQWLVVDADIVKILPQPDGKVTLEFWGDGKQFPTIKVNKWKQDDAAGLMKHVMSNSMATAAEVRCPCKVYYLEGKQGGTTSDGKPWFWKNISHVRPR